VQVKPLSLRPPRRAVMPDGAAVRRSAAAALRAAGRAMQRLGRHLTSTPTRAPPVAQPTLLEFYAEAGAPEGALYVDGQLAAHLAGVRRL